MIREANLQMYYGLLQDSREEGRTEGITEGREEERLKNAKALLQEGMERAAIIRILKLTSEKARNF